MEFTLEKLEVYNIAETFCDDIWNIVMQWDYYRKDTVGKQLVRAADSISARDILSALRITGTIKPLGALTAISIST